MREQRRASFFVAKSVGCLFTAAMFDRLFRKNSVAKSGPDVEEPLLIVPIPALVAVLLAKEREKGDPLTEDQVLAIRDGAVCMAMPADVARKMSENRGYDDIDPEDVWAQWQAIRLTLLTSDS